VGSVEHICAAVQSALVAHPTLNAMAPRVDCTARPHQIISGTASVIFL
jgi:hypothetical protein